MKLRCLNCGLVLEGCLSLDCVCPECGASYWGVIIGGSEEKINKKSLDIIKDLLQQMNKDYRDFIEKHLLADLPIDPIEFSKFYQAQLERIMDIKL